MMNYEETQYWILDISFDGDVYAKSFISDEEYLAKNEDVDFYRYTLKEVLRIQTSKFNSEL